MVSVVIPCYNNQRYLAKCVRSVLEQTYGNLEIIIVDDGSDDDPAEALADISDSRLMPLIKAPHRGVSRARNIGIEAARGEYIVFVDGDDWIEPCHIETLVRGLDEADGSMVLMSIDFPDGESEIRHPEVFAEPKPICADSFHRIFDAYRLSSPCDKIYRANLLKGSEYLRFDEMTSYAEDLIFNLEYFAKLKSVKLTDAATYHYVKHRVSGTTRFHANTAYTLRRLSNAVSGIFHEFAIETLAILMHHYVWGLLNLFHRDSSLTSRQRRLEIAQIVGIPLYRKSLASLPKIGLNRLFNQALRTCSPFMIDSALRIRCSR